MTAKHGGKNVLSCAKYAERNTNSNFIILSQSGEVKLGFFWFHVLLLHFLFYFENNSPFVSGQMPFLMCLGLICLLSVSTCYPLPLCLNSLCFPQPDASVFGLFVSCDKLFVTAFRHSFCHRFG